MVLTLSSLAIYTHAGRDRYSLTELADLAGVTPRTVRYYLSQGLLPAVGQSGPGSKYGAPHLARLRVIRRLQAEHLPLAEIRRRLDGLDDDEIRDLAGSGEPLPPPGSALDYLRSVLGGSKAGRSPALLRVTPGVPPPIRIHAELASAPVAATPVRTTAPDAVAERLDEPDGSTPATVAAAPGPPIERSQWERIVLAPDVELHIRRPLARAQNKQVDRLVTIARELLEEERP
jgi:DNA-binding transcriptional MerR regulator